MPPAPPPKPILAGRRVRLRPLTAADAPAMWAALDDPESARLTGGAETFSLDQVAAHCRRIETASDRLDYGVLALDPPAEDGGLDAPPLIGEVVLNEIDWSTGTANFRIALWGPDARDRGYGAEAARLLLRHGFAALELQAVELEVYAFNPRAQAVYVKLGFEETARRVDDLTWGNETTDAVEMRLTRRRFEAIDQS